jgi:O-acetyl-ADP-ribose deacetylase (regulator of RNase III)
MPIQFTKGDLFHTSGIRAYAQGVSCAGSMDAGVAVAFKKRWPRMAEEYTARCSDGRFNLGDVFVWTEGDETVYTLGIQMHWKDRARLAALTRALSRTVEFAERAGVEKIGLPRIGTGLGGLDWNRVKDVLQKIGQATPITLVVFEQFIRAKES